MSPVQSCLQHLFFRARGDGAYKPTIARWLVAIITSGDLSELGDNDLAFLASEHASAAFWSLSVFDRVVEEQARRVQHGN